MTPYTAAESTERLRRQRTPLFLAPLSPVLMAIAMLTSNSLDLWFGIALLALILATASFMRLIWQVAHYQDFSDTRECQILKAISLSAVPIVVLALALHFLI